VKIKSENPEDHWGFLNVKNKTVVDFGCGRTWNQNPTTPEFFLQKEAKKVIAIEMWPNEIEWFKENVKNENLILITDQIDSGEKIKKYIVEYKPEVIKCDIEGAEKYLYELSNEIFNPVQEMAIEYHDEEIKSKIISECIKWGFNYISLFSINGFDFDKQGVIFIKKIIE